MANEGTPFILADGEMDEKITNESLKHQLAFAKPNQIINLTTVISQHATLRGLFNFRNQSNGVRIKYTVFVVTYASASV